MTVTKMNWIKLLEEEAKQKLTPTVLEYLNRSTESTYGNEEIKFNNPKKTINKLPTILLGAVGAQTYFHEDGELATAKAAAEKNIPFIVGINSSYSVEEISDVSNEHTLWFSANLLQDIDLTKHFVQRAELAGYQAIVIPLSNNSVNGMDSCEKGNGNFVVDPIFHRKAYGKDKEAFQQLILSEYNTSSVNWEKINYLQQFTTLPVYLQGDVQEQDIRQALKYRISGVILPNGLKLRAMRDIVGEAFHLIVETDVYSKEDIQYYLASGADAVSIQKAYIYGLSTDGISGVKKVIDQLISY
ncbi:MULTISPECIES: alpha-hydroxy-acid oxidizing protein [Gracilibacillus]|uniref:FMN hydroxy acid dehydrogenase domain-containing protein n=1 Tax=Gracilibacillus dipsosauri TaxID=178340 RepID=A0A317L663_9BACI|nr:alpha-hydroxy-acid oxidizing protein [Gracilibacillus dipsosauri]PWU69249.1 hypothetical protein DLJ74_04480 [Gracilibacillus dipsosauri]